MKVGIASCYYNHNYGSMLQAYATQRAVEKLGHEAVTIQCMSPINYMTQSKVRYYCHKLLNVDIVKTKIRQYRSKTKRKKYPEVIQGTIVRDSYFEDFYKKHVNLSKKKKDRDDLIEFSKQCDAIVVGSDMLWHPVNVEHDYYTLTFVPANISKIAYATSFGTSIIPKYQTGIYRKFLSRFDSISVREISGVKVIENLNINKKACVVLDPTLLFDREDWMTIQMNEPVISEKYILCYYLGVNPEHRNFARKIKEITGYKIVALQHLDEFVENDMDYADIVPYNIGPSEFVNLIRNAEYICTDSFHGSCFSILNHKKFFTFNRFQNQNSQSTNTRIDSLLELSGLTNRRVADLSSLSQINKMLENEIDYDVVDQKIEAERQKSFEFLKKSLDIRGANRK